MRDIEGTKLKFQVRRAGNVFGYRAESRQNKAR